MSASRSVIAFAALLLGACDESATADVDASSGTVTFSNVTIDHHGRYYLQFRLMSTPAEFDLYAPSDAHIDVFPAGALRAVENLFFVIF